MKIVDLTGQRFGLLTVLRYSHSRCDGAAWEVACECGTIKVVAATNLRTGQSTTCGDRAVHHNAGNGKGTSYNAIHDRLRRTFGPAKDHLCVECGEPAHDWTFDQPYGFVPDMSRFSPRCRSCHQAQRRGKVPINPVDHPAFAALRRALENA